MDGLMDVWFKLSIQVFPLFAIVFQQNGRPMFLWYYDLLSPFLNFCRFEIFTQNNIYGWNMNYGEKKRKKKKNG